MPLLELGVFPQWFLNAESNIDWEEGLHVIDNNYLLNSFQATTQVLT